MVKDEGTFFEGTLAAGAVIRYDDVLVFVIVLRELIGVGPCSHASLYVLTTISLHIQPLFGKTAPPPQASAIQSKRDELVSGVAGIHSNGQSFLLTIPNWGSAQET